MKDEQASEKGALMRAVRAIVSLFGSPLGEAMRKMAKGTGLGLGKP